MAKSKIVYIKSIPRDTASKISEFRNSETGKKLNKNKIGDCADKIQALFSIRMGALKTGLTKEDEAWAEEKWNKPKGYFNNMPWRRGDSLDHKDMPYFQRKSWTLKDGTTTLDLDSMDDWCFYKVCMASKFVANSEKEWKTYKWPKATHYIALENESDEIKYKKNHLKSKAFGKLHSKELTLPWKRKFAVIFEKSNSRITLTEEQVENMLFDLIENSKMKGLKSDIDKFLDACNQLKTADGKMKLENLYLLKTLLDYNIIEEKAGTYKHLKTDKEIGFTEKEALEYLAHPKKQGQIDELKKELEIKRG